MKVYIQDKDGKSMGQTLKENVKSKFQSAKNWAIRNKDAIIVIAPFALGTATVFIKTVGKGVNIRRQENVKKLYCYDASLGHYWAIRRELSNREWLYIDSRKKNGERISDILSELGVLK